MAEEAPAAAPAKAAKEKVVKPKKSGPSVGELIVKAVAASEERSCVSDPASIPPSRVAKVALIQTKGTGASGSFKINKKAKTRSKTPAKKPTVAKKPKAASAKKPTAAKKFP